MLDKNGTAKLGELGLVNALYLNTVGIKELSSVPNETARTYFYWQAPEVFTDGLKYGRKADIWLVYL